ncbi:MAG TPA: protein kinase [Gemmatimonadaceae bacterium]|nr:protein kinase [Gemmatimonadaceae bacterium]
MTFPSIPAFDPAARRNRIAYIALWGVYAVIVLFAIGIETVAVIRDNGAQKPLGWSYALVEKQWRVQAINPQGPAAGLLETGDRIVAIDGNPSAERIGPKWFLRDSPDRNDYTITVSRQGSELTRKIPWPTVYSSFEGRWQWAGLVCVILTLAVGLLIAFGRPDSEIARRAVISNMLTIGFWLTFVVETPTGVISHMPLVLALSYFFIRPYHIVAGYWFVKAFPLGDQPSKAWRRFDRIFFPACLLIWVPSAYVAAIRSLGPQRAVEIAAAQYPLSIVHDGIVNSMYFLFAAVAAFAQGLVCWRNYKLVPPGDLQRRLRWVSIGVVIGMVPIVAVAPFLFIKNFAGVRPSLLVHVVNTMAMLVPLCIAYAILRYRVMGIRVVIRSGLRYLFAKNVLRIALALPVVLLITEVITHPTRRVDALLTGPSGRVNILMLVLAGVALRYRTALMTWIDRRFFREAYRQDRIFLSLAEAIGKAADIQSLASLLSSQIQSALHPTRVLALTRGESSSLDLVYSSESSVTASLADFGIRSNEIQDVTGIAEIRDLTHLSPDGRRALETLGIALIVPIRGPNEGLVGLILLGDKKSEEPYTRNDRKLLETTASQTGIVWENLQLRQALAREKGARRHLAARLDGASAYVVECPECGTCYDGDVERCSLDGRELLPSLPTSRTLDGKYRLNRVIGRGGVGAVYEATDLRLDRTVAVKAVMASMFEDTVARQRFAREARASARIVHPNVVGVFDLGEFEGGAYLVLELLRGRTLRAELEKRRKFSPSGAQRILENIFDGIAAAHAEHVVHRDLKPENVFLVEDRDGNVAGAKLLDFGLAVARDVEFHDGSKLTRTGTAVGTVAYMSPEQLVGESVDERTDIHALGIIVLEMLTGSLDLKGPFFARGETVLSERLGGPDHSSNERAVAEVLRRAFHPTKEERYASTEEFRRELFAVLLLLAEQ